MKTTRYAGTIYTNNKFKGHWPVGTAAVVVAENTMAAAAVLNQELNQRGLESSARPEDMIPFGQMESVRILCDGDY